MTTSDPTTTSADVLAEALGRLQAMDLGDGFEPRAAQAIVATGLHRLVVPLAAGGLGGRMADAAEDTPRDRRRRRLDGTRLRDELHVIGALLDGDAVPTGLRDRLFARS